MGFGWWTSGSGGVGVGQGKHARSVFVGWRSEIKKVFFEFFGAGRGGPWSGGGRGGGGGGGREGGVPGRGGGKGEKSVFWGPGGKGRVGGGRQDYLPCKGLPGRSTPKAGSADFGGRLRVPLFEAIPFCHPGLACPDQSFRQLGVSGKQPHFRFRATGRTQIAYVRCCSPPIPTGPLKRGIK